MTEEVQSRRVIYPNDDGGVSVIHPSPSCLSIGKMIEAVPAGKPYQVVNASDIPTDRTYRNAWTFEEE